jgi:tetratricopeptide (TPR) repeat protein
LAAIHFARGSFALFHGRGSATLDSAYALEATGLRMYAMIASQLRYLYYAARGELLRAAPHRDQVELHAAHVGSLWQAETWEAPFLILIQAVAMGDVVGSARVVDRLSHLSRSVPSLRRYYRLARDAMAAVHEVPRRLREMADQHAALEPRSFIGWAATMSAVALAYNKLGDPAEAKRTCERVMSQLTDADRDFPGLFVHIELQLALADAQLGEHEGALLRVDRLLARFRGSDNPLLMGLLHEMRALVCYHALRYEDYELSRSSVDT